MEKTAFVLAGGGSKGAFEAGALRYLIEEAGWVPDVITATSVGAIMGTVLAQGRTPEEYRRHLAELADDVLAMTHDGLVFGRPSWLRSLDGTPLARAIDHFITERTRPPVPGTDPGHRPPAPRPARGAGWRRLEELARLASPLRRAIQAFRQDGRSMLTLEPLARAVRHGQEEGIHPIDPVKVARPGLQLRLAVAALGAGVLRYVGEDGTLFESDGVTPAAGEAAGPVDVIEGMLASAAVPAVFPPVPLADDVYVDGGVVQNIPVAPAAALGATRIVAVVAVPLDQPRDFTDFTRANFGTVFLRSVAAISFAERQRADLAVALPEGTTLTVVDPTVDVVGPFEVALGLMALDMEYGWLRAADVLSDLDDEARREVAAGTDAVVTARTRAWHLEESLFGVGRVGAADRAALRQLKQQVWRAVERRKELGLPIPSDAERWWRGYEIHVGEAPVGLPEDPSEG